MGRKPRPGPTLEELTRDGECNGVGVEIFFPGTNVEPFSDSLEDYTEARRICGQCDHQAQCANYAVEERIPFGMFGGRSAYERFRILAAREPSRYKVRKRKRRPCVLCGRVRLLKFFDTADRDVCQECAGTAPPVRERLDGKERKPRGRPRLVPDDDILLPLFTQGLTNAEIAQRYNVKPSTLQYHRRRLIGRTRLSHAAL